MLFNTIHRDNKKSYTICISYDVAYNLLTYTSAILVREPCQGWGFYSIYYSDKHFAFHSEALSNIYR